MVKMLALECLEFPFVWFKCQTERGVSFHRLVRYGMPRIAPNVIKCVFYLYEDEKAALAGRDPGGTGFFLAVPSTEKRPYGWRTHVYAVTNWHVAVDDSDQDSPPCPVIRLNGKDGQPAIIPFTKDDWRYIPGGVDVAVVPIDNPDEYDILAVPHDMSLHPDDVANETIGIGDDVFMIGLFVDHSGGPRNVPAARFGNISMTPSPDAPVPQDNLGQGEAFVLDLHSRTGYSGSPVFVYRTFGSDLTMSVADHFRVHFDERRREKISIDIEFENVFKFLGVHFAQFPEELEGKDGEPITGLSGMTCAIPAWKLFDILNLPEFQALRSEKEKQMAKAAKKAPRPEKTSIAKPPPDATDADRFKRLLGAAVKPPKSSDQT